MSAVHGAGATVRYAETYDVARLTLARPPLNVMTIAMMVEINDARDRAAANPVLKALPRAERGGPASHEARGARGHRVLFERAQEPMKLCGKTALVTGGGRGIGRGIARALARRDEVDRAVAETVAHSRRRPPPT